MSLTDHYPKNLLRVVRQMGHEAWYFREKLFREDDIWLASYPRSGNHFTRFILVSARHYLQHGNFPANLSGMRTIPDVHGGRLEYADKSPRIIKTHFPYDPRYRRVIHLIRDPRDVIISYFHYSQGLPRLFSEPPPTNYNISQFIDLFLRGKVWPGDIREHSISYINRADSIEYTQISYEALLSEPQQEYRRLLNAADVSFPEERLGGLIEHTSFANMRRLHSPETARAGMVESNPVYILRSGISGEHAHILNDKDRTRVEEYLNFDFK